MKAKALLDKLIEKNATKEISIFTPLEGLKDTDTIVAPDFPLSVLPAKHAEIVEQCSNFLGFPKDFTAVSMLGAAAVAVGRTCEIDNEMWTDGTCLYLCIVASPGKKKSHPLDFALKPCLRKNKKMIKNYNDSKAANAAAAQQGQFFAEPQDQQFIYGDFTIETLVKGYNKNKRGISVYLDELKAWINNFNRYNAGSESEFWIMNWSGKTFSLNRANSKSVVERTDIPVMGTMQPGHLDDFGKSNRGISGFVERILFCYPDKVESKPLPMRINRVPEMREKIMENYNRLVAPLLALKAPEFVTDEEGDEDEVRIRYVLSEEADNTLIAWMNMLEMKANEQSNEYIQSVYSKMQTYVCRFVLLLQLMHEAAGEIKDDSFPPKQNQEIEADIVRKATNLANYFIKHNLKANSKINDSNPLDRLPQNIRAWYADLPSGQELTVNKIEEISMKHGISRQTMYNYLNRSDVTKKIFIKTRYGIYEKLYHR